MGKPGRNEEMKKWTGNGYFRLPCLDLLLFIISTRHLLYEVNARTKCSMAVHQTLSLRESREFGHMRLIMTVTSLSLADHIIVNG